jgi:N-acetylglutamate synthase-like GNAT family acetyltransferase
LQPGVVDKTTFSFYAIEMIRYATENDLRAITAILNENGTGATEDKIKDVEDLVSQRAAFVTEQDGEVIAYGAIDYSNNTIAGLYVLSSYRRRGFGTALLDHMESELHSRGVGEIPVSAAFGSDPFFAKRGYVETGPATRGEWSIVPMKKVFTP